MTTGPLDEPYADALAHEVLAIQGCDQCGHRQHPPALRCERCGATSLSPVEADGAGVVVSYAVLHRGPTEWHSGQAPYRYAIVELDEGPRVVTQLRPRAGRWPVCGDRVRARFVRLDSQPAVVFQAEEDSR